MESAASYSLQSCTTKSSIWGPDPFSPIGNQFDQILWPDWLIFMHLANQIWKSRFDFAQIDHDLRKVVTLTKMYYADSVIEPG